MRKIKFRAQDFSGKWQYGYVARFNESPYAVWENGFADYSIVIPPDSVLEMFNLLVSPILEIIRDSYKESRRLAELRDALLPKLMSGEFFASKASQAPSGK